MIDLVYNNFFNFHYQVKYYLTYFVCLVINSFEKQILSLTLNIEL